MSNQQASQEYNRFEALAKKLFSAKLKPESASGLSESKGQGFGEQQPRRKTKRKS